MLLEVCLVTLPGWAWDLSIFLFLFCSEFSDYQGSLFFFVYIPRVIIPHYHIVKNRILSVI